MSRDLLDKNLVQLEKKEVQGTWVRKQDVDVQILIFLEK